MQMCSRQRKNVFERVAERMSSLSKLKSVLVTDSHAQLLQRPCSATYGHEQRRRRLPSAQLGDDEGDHAARSASRGQEPTPSPLSTRVEDRDESL